MRHHLLVSIVGILVVAVAIAGLLVEWPPFPILLTRNKMKIASL